MNIQLKPVIGSVCALIIMLGMPALAAERFECKSFRDVIPVFEKLDYTAETWKDGLRKIPRVYLVSVLSRWRDKTYKEVEVVMKKGIFFRRLAPLLRANETLLIDRQRLLSLNDVTTSKRDAAWVGNLAHHCKLVDDATNRDWSIER